MFASPCETVKVVTQIMTFTIRLLRVDEIIQASQNFRTILFIWTDIMM